MGLGKRAVTKTSRGLCAAAVVCALPTAALAAGGTVVLLDGAVPQYQETARAVRARLKGPAVMLDIAQEDNPLGAITRVNPKVIVAVGQKALGLVANRAGDVAIVYCTVLHPERHGLLSPSIVGVPLEIPSAVQLGRFKEVAPRARRLGVIYSANSAALVEDATRAAEKLGLQIIARSVNGSREVGSAFDGMVGKIDALFLVPDTKLINRDIFSYLVSATLDKNIPLFGFLEGLTEAGALASIGPDYSDIGSRAADLANQVLAGSALSTLPAKTHSGGALSVNLKTAARLGLEIDERVLSGAQKLFR